MPQSGKKAVYIIITYKVTGHFSGDLDCTCLCVCVLYSGKLSREKTFTNFAVLWLFAKVSSVKCGGVASFGTAQASNPRKFSLRKSPIYESFLPRKFFAIWYYK